MANYAETEGRNDEIIQVKKRETTEEGILEGILPTQKYTEHQF